MAEWLLRLRLEQGQALPAFPLPAAAVRKDLEPFGLADGVPVSDLLPGGTIYLPLRPAAGGPVGTSITAEGYIRQKRLKKARFLARDRDLLRRLFLPAFQQDALERVLDGRWLCDQGILAPGNWRAFPALDPRPDQRIGDTGLTHRMVCHALQDTELALYLNRPLALVPGAELELGGARLRVLEQSPLESPPSANRHWLLLSAGIPAASGQLPQAEGSAGWRVALLHGVPALRPGSWLAWDGPLPPEFWMGTPPCLMRL